MKTLLLHISLLFITTAVFAQSEVTLEGKRFSPNWFNDLQKAKADPDKVYYLDLSLQKLRSFPKEIFAFKNLKELYISYNYWPEIPVGLGTLSQLEILDISGNYYLHKLPDDLGKLKNLKELNLKDNKLNAGEVDKAKQELPTATVTADKEK